jgi:hypothetical protein
MVATALAVAGVVGALSLAGIFIVYLIDTIGGDDSNDSTQVRPSGSTGSTSPSLPDGGTGQTGPTGPTPEAPGGATGFNPKLNKIPDDQQYASFNNASGGYSVEYPKGWSAKGKGDDVTWESGKNSERVVVASTQKQSVRDVKRALRNNKAAKILLDPRTVSLGSTRPVKSVFQQVGATNEQGAAIKIIVDQYRFYRGGKVATLDLVTTGAVRRDNLDDWDRIARSFRWL